MWVETWDRLELGFVGPSVGRGPKENRHQHRCRTARVGWRARNSSRLRVISHPAIA